MDRKVKNKVKGFRTQDGAGVSLVRVLGGNSINDYDPFLMLDSFDSTNPDDYTKGFPMHPHRGIETISYVYRGQMTHKDSIGNEDTIKDGEVQWMTAGSGILHEEKLPASERMLGIQLWLNLPKEHKMVEPFYHAIKNKDIEEIKIDGGYIRLLAGKFLEHEGYESKYLPLDYYDIHLDEDKEFLLTTKENSSVVLFTLSGDVYINDELIDEKTAVNLTDGDRVKLKGAKNGSQVLFLQSKRLDESVAWGGPIVMNTQEELMKAFDELREGTFIKEKANY